MSRAVSPSAARVYGLALVTRCWKVSRASLYRHRQAAPASRCRPGPDGPCDDATLVEHIKRAISESRFAGEGYRKIWARLRFFGIRSSPGRIRRLMRENCFPDVVEIAPKVRPAGCFADPRLGVRRGR